jgi:hypothetical protein
MDVLLHPVALGALALWLLNDHVLKAALPGLVTGKVSDVAGMIVAPLALTAAVRAAAGLRCGPLARAVPWGALLAVALVFTAVKTSPAANEVWCDVATAARAPLHALAVWLHGAPFSERVILVRDPTDLIALPFGLLAGYLGKSAK